MIDTSILPSSPGCYLFKDEEEMIIYVGKAKNLKKRIKSYFSKRDLDPKTAALVAHAEYVDCIATDTEVEALILENTLIKRHQPKYNIDLKDEKGFSYIRVTDESYPRLLLARNKIGKGRYYGPFVSAAERQHILKLLRRLFHIRTCKRLPKRPCLRYHIHLCDGPCMGDITSRQYAERIRRAELVLSGNTRELIRELESEMKDASAEKDYERALVCRDQIAALKHLSDHQKMERDRQIDEDVISFEKREDTIYLLVFNIYKGMLSKKSVYSFEALEGWLEEFIVRFYSEHPIPKEIIVPTPLDDTILSFLHIKRGNAVKITVPQRGEKKKLLELARRNIEITFFSHLKKIEALGKALSLPEPPLIVECFDISHLSGTNVVGSMVQFRNGIADKSNYRRFKIKTVEGIDDFACIAEVVKRRYKRLLDEKSEFPDLVIIDGGKGQLNAALKSLEGLDIHLPVIGIAKRDEEIYLPGMKQPLRLRKDTDALKFVMEIRDEAHRFAITYNRTLRKKELVG